MQVKQYLLLVGPCVKKYNSSTTSKTIFETTSETQETTTSKTILETTSETTTSKTISEQDVCYKIIAVLGIVYNSRTLSLLTFSICYMGYFTWETNDELG